MINNGASVAMIVVRGGVAAREACPVSTTRPGLEGPAVLADG